MAADPQPPAAPPSRPATPTAPTTATAIDADYLLSALDGRGRRVTRRVTARSVDEAMKLMRREGSARSLRSPTISRRCD
jgi:hypothetical protein